MIFTSRETVQDTTVNLLRAAFSVDVDWHWDSDADLRTIDIFTSFPKNASGYPIIVVQNSSGPALPRTFNGDLIGEERGLMNIDGLTVNGICYQIFGGSFELTTEIFVGSQSAATRTKILDKVVLFLRYLFRDYLESRGIDVTGVRYGSQRVESYGAQLLYFNSVILDTFISWQDTVWDVEVIKDIVEKLSIIQPDGITQAF